MAAELCFPFFVHTPCVYVDCDIRGKGGWRQKGSVIKTIMSITQALIIIKILYSVIRIKKVITRVKIIMPSCKGDMIIYKEKKNPRVIKANWIRE